MSWRDQIKPQAVVVQRSLETPQGQALLDLLEKTFQRGTLLGDDMSQTAYAIGQFELVEYLKELRDLELVDE